MDCSSTAGGAEPEPDGRQGVDVGRHGVGVGLAPDLEQLLEQGPHPGLLDHPEPPARAEPVADPQPDAVEGADVWALGRREPSVRAAGSFISLGGPGVEGQGGDRAGITPRSDTRWRRRSVSTLVLPDPAGAITRAAPEAWSTAARWSGGQVGHRRGTGGRPAAAGRPRRSSGAPPRPRSAGVRWVGRRAAVDDTAACRRPARCRPAPLRRTPPSAASAAPPCGRATTPARRPGVVGVGPDQEVQALQGELEIRREIMDRAVVALGRPEGPRVDAELDHHRPAPEPGLVQAIRHGPRVGHLGIPDAHSRAGRPGFGHVAPGEHDHTPAEFGRSGVRHLPNIARGCNTPTGDRRTPHPGGRPGPVGSRSPRPGAGAVGV